MISARRRAGNARGSSANRHSAARAVPALHVGQFADDDSGVGAGGEFESQFQ